MNWERSITSHPRVSESGSKRPATPCPKATKGELDLALSVLSVLCRIAKQKQQQNYTSHQVPPQQAQLGVAVEEQECCGRESQVIPLTSSSSQSEKQTFKFNFQIQTSNIQSVEDITKEKLPIEVPALKLKGPDQLYNSPSGLQKIENIFIKTEEYVENPDFDVKTLVKSSMPVEIICLDDDTELNDGTEELEEGEIVEDDDNEETAFSSSKESTPNLEDPDLRGIYSKYKESHKNKSYNNEYIVKIAKEEAAIMVANIEDRNKKGIVDILSFHLGKVVGKNNEAETAVITSCEVNNMKIKRMNAVLYEKCLDVKVSVGDQVLFQASKCKWKPLINGKKHPTIVTKVFQVNSWNSGNQSKNSKFWAKNVFQKSSFITNIQSDQISVAFMQDNQLMFALMKVTSLVRCQKATDLRIGECLNIIVKPISISESRSFQGASYQYKVVLGFRPSDNPRDMALCMLLNDFSKNLNLNLSLMKDLESYLDVKVCFIHQSGQAESNGILLFGPNATRSHAELLDLIRWYRTYSQENRSVNSLPALHSYKKEYKVKQKISMNLMRNGTSRLCFDLIKTITNVTISSKTGIVTFVGPTGKHVEIAVEILQRTIDRMPTIFGICKFNFSSLQFEVHEETHYPVPPQQQKSTTESDSTKPKPAVPVSGTDQENNCNVNASFNTHSDTVQEKNSEKVVGTCSKEEENERKRDEAQQKRQEERKKIKEREKHHQKKNDEEMSTIEEKELRRKEENAIKLAQQKKIEKEKIEREKIEKEKLKIENIRKRVEKSREARQNTKLVTKEASRSPILDLPEPCPIQSKPEKLSNVKNSCNLSKSSDKKGRESVQLEKIRTTFDQAEKTYSKLVQEENVLLSQLPKFQEKEKRLVIFSSSEPEHDIAGKSERNTKVEKEKTDSFNKRQRDEISMIKNEDRLNGELNPTVKKLMPNEENEKRNIIETDNERLVVLIQSENEPEAGPSRNVVEIDDKPDDLPHSEEQLPEIKKIKLSSLESWKGCKLLSKQLRNQATLPNNGSVLCFEFFYFGGCSNLKSCQRIHEIPTHLDLEFCLKSWKTKEDCGNPDCTKEHRSPKFMKKFMKDELIKLLSHCEKCNFFSHNHAVIESPEESKADTMKTNGNKRKVCWHFKKGSCSFGEDCSKSHDYLMPPLNTSGPAKKKPKVVCRHFQEGRCAFGDKCHKSHDVAQEESYSWQPFYQEYSDSQIFGRPDQLQNNDLRLTLDMQRYFN